MAQDLPQVSVGKAVADRIQAAVDASALSQEFSPRRNYGDWDIDLAKMDLPGDAEENKLYVDVVTHTTEQQLSIRTRDKVAFIVPVDIGVRRKFGHDKREEDTGRVRVEEVDKLVNLVGELALLFIQQRLSDFPAAVWDTEAGGTQIPVNPNKEHLRELFQFTGVVRVYFKVHHSLLDGNE